MCKLHVNAIQKSGIDKSRQRMQFICFQNDRHKFRVRPKLSSLRLKSIYFSIFHRFRCSVQIVLLFFAAQIQSQPQKNTAQPNYNIRPGDA